MRMVEGTYAEGIVQLLHLLVQIAVLLLIRLHSCP